MPKHAFIIGLTGNIASGKSVVRQMLQNYGALTIDADLLAQRTYARHAPAYDEIISHFGVEILDEDNEIDRKRLGQIVFSDPQQLRHLEEIVHPYTLDALDFILKQARTSVIVLEMIKLIEIGLGELCDSIWVCTAPDQVRAERLVNERSLSVQQAYIRINSQQSQQLKIDQADVVIDTDCNFTRTWEQVQAGIEKEVIPVDKTPGGRWMGDSLRVRPLTFGDVVTCAEFYSNLRGTSVQVEEVFKILGTSSLMSYWHKQELVGLLNWRMANFVTLLIELISKPGQSYPRTGRMLRIFESLSDQHLCEMLCISANSGLVMDGQKQFNYILPAKFSNPAWQSLVTRYLTQDTPVYFKELKRMGQMISITEKLAFNRLYL
jgi:dephospho-CoA kinase